MAVAAGLVPAVLDALAHAVLDLIGREVDIDHHIRALLGLNACAP